MSRATALFLVLCLLAACGNDSPEAVYKSGCSAMTKRQENVEPEEREKYCSCLIEQTAGLTDTDRKTLGLLMKNPEYDKDIRIGMDAAAEDGKLSISGATLYFESSIRCSLIMVL